jgi:hypothetical protein
MTARVLAAAVACGCACVLALGGCKARRGEIARGGDGGVFERPADHLAKDELVPQRETLLGMPLPVGFVKVDAQPGEEAAQGEATLEAMRRHVLEHSMNGVARPEPGALVWWDAEIPGRGALRFEVRVSEDGRGRVTIVVREQAPRAAIDGGSGEVLRALGLDDRGYPVGFDKLR